MKRSSFLADISKIKRKKEDLLFQQLSFNKIRFYFIYKIVKNIRAIHESLETLEKYYFIQNCFYNLDKRVYYAFDSDSIHKIRNGYD